MQTSAPRAAPPIGCWLLALLREALGGHGWANAELDRIAGRAWERAGGGLFLMVRDRADGLDPLGQLRRKLDG